MLKVPLSAYRPITVGGQHVVYWTGLICMCRFFCIPVHGIAFLRAIARKKWFSPARVIMCLARACELLCTPRLGSPHWLSVGGLAQTDCVVPVAHIVIHWSNSGTAWSLAGEACCGTAGGGMTSLTGARLPGVGSLRWRACNADEWLQRRPRPALPQLGFSRTVSGCLVVVSVAGWLIFLAESCFLSLCIYYFVTFGTRSFNCFECELKTFIFLLSFDLEFL